MLELEGVRDVHLLPDVVIHHIDVCLIHSAVSFCVFVRAAQMQRPISPQMVGHGSMTWRSLALLFLVLREGRRMCDGIVCSQKCPRHAGVSPFEERVTVGDSSAYSPPYGRRRGRIFRLRQDARYDMK